MSCQGIWFKPNHISCRGNDAASTLGKFRVLRGNNLKDILPVHILIFTPKDGKVGDIISLIIRVRDTKFSHSIINIFDQVYIKFT